MYRRIWLSVSGGRCVVEGMEDAGQFNGQISPRVTRETALGMFEVPTDPETTIDLLLVIKKENRRYHLLCAVIDVALYWINKAKKQGG